MSDKFGAHQVLTQPRSCSQFFTEALNLSFLRLNTFDHCIVLKLVFTQFIGGYCYSSINIVWNILVSPSENCFLKESRRKTIA